MAFTFKKTLENVSVRPFAAGRYLSFLDTCIQIGNSLFDAPGAEKVAELVAKAKTKNVKVVFPVDYVTADKFDKDAQVPCHYIINPVIIDGHVPDWNGY
jgi:3-phosphoglycerate kinase